ncbi:hypothetical protein Bhyg_07114 [Pseudolycoriella hygida]|uniref:N-acetyltransferase domain-containing protein n=1 Tax=Pseudolycoriella hygida TaxID=35572 RepID=A0A9Q0N335_9DIPT|nr:hypothetical protein Bhyg_07114 [Pseudolycoriella hygida]
MEFERPNGMQGPMVYSTFQIKSKHSDEVEEFLIQDLTENYFDEAVNIIVENHAKCAVFHQAAKTLLSESGIRRVNEMYLNVFKEKISLVCLKMDTMEIVAVNALTYRDSEATNDANLNLIRDTVAFLNNEFNVMDHYGVHRVISAAGLCVVEKYRNRGIATKMLQARVPLLKCIGIKVTTTIFSTPGAQKAARAAGYEENYSISYDDLGKNFNKMDFSKFSNGFCKVMSLKV